MSVANAFIFLCNLETESECLQKQLVGTSYPNAMWAAEIKPGEDIYLFNFDTRVVRGPYSSTSIADAHDPAAWAGKFPLQVRVSATPRTRKADARSTNSPSILKKRLPTGAVDDPAELFSWIQRNGETA